MNRAQKVVLLIGIALFAVASLYVPWQTANYAWIFSHRMLDRIAMSRLATEWICIIVVTAGAILALRGPISRQKPGERV